MNKFAWKDKDKLKEQLKFFKAKKQKFISVYAKKPRIRVKVKRDEYNNLIDAYEHQKLQQVAALANLRSSQASALANLAGGVLGYGLSVNNNGQPDMSEAVNSFGNIAAPATSSAFEFLGL